MIIDKIKNTKLLICGGRHFDNYDFLEIIVDGLLDKYELDLNDLEIVSGHCDGADKLGEKYAQLNNIRCKVFPAQWRKYGRSAGPIRNSEMLKYMSDSDLPIVLAFISSKSKGTRDTVNKAKKLKYVVEEIPYETVTMDLSLVEGVSSAEEDLVFDFDNDPSTDILSLTKRAINKTNSIGNIRYFGYKIRIGSSDGAKKEHLHWDNTDAGHYEPNVVKMVQACVREYVSDSPNYDYIIPVYSFSKFTEIITNTLSKSLNCPILTTSKLDNSCLSVDEDKIEKEVKQGEEYKHELTKYLNNRYIEPQLKTGKFSIRMVSPKYRKWIKPMLKFDLEGVSFDNISRVLIVDETITSGETIQQIISLLRYSGYIDDIDIYTLSLIDS